PRGRAEREQRLRFGCEQYVAADHGVEERLDAEAIARRDQPAAPFIGDDDSKFSAQMMDEFCAVLLVKMERDFAVAVGRERNALPRELGADRLVAVELAIDDAAHIAPRIDDRLVAIHEPDDAEPDMTERHAAVGRKPISGLIGSAMTDRGQRRLHPL